MDYDDNRFMFTDLRLCWKLIPCSKLIHLKRSAKMQLNRLLVEGPTSKKPQSSPKTNLSGISRYTTLIPCATTVYYLLDLSSQTAIK